VSSAAITIFHRGRRRTAHGEYAREKPLMGTVLVVTLPEEHRGAVSVTASTAAPME